MLWQIPIVVWTNTGELKPGMLAFVPNVAPVHLVYSNGNHYDALFYLVSEIDMICTTFRLHEKLIQATALARSNVINLENTEDEAMPMEEATDQFVRHSEVPNGAACNESARVTHPGALCAGQKSFQRIGFANGNVQKAHGKWRVGLHSQAGKFRSRVTIPFDFATEEMTNCAYQYVLLHTHN
jgi:hypothetical protein